MRSNMSRPHASRNLIPSLRVCCIAAALVVAATPFEGNQLSAAAPLAPITYQAIDLGVYPGDAFSYAADINSFGRVVGWGFDSAFTRSRALTWANGAITDLGTLPAPFDLGAEALGVNDRGRSSATASGPADPVRLSGTKGT